MNVEVSPWFLAVAIDVFLSGFVAAYIFYIRGLDVEKRSKGRVIELQKSLEDAKAEARRIEEEAARRRTIVTFENEDIEGLVNSGKMAGDEEAYSGLKTRISESTGVLTEMSAAAEGIGNALTETMEKQMEAVNMVGRLGGTKGLPPEFKEKAEAILDAFRVMDETLSGAHEEISRIEGGLTEVSSIVADFKSADINIKLPSADILNDALRSKTTGGDVVEVVGGGLPSVEGPGPEASSFGIEEDSQVMVNA